MAAWVPNNRLHCMALGIGFIIITIIIMESKWTFSASESLMDARIGFLFHISFPAFKIRT